MHMIAAADTWLSAESSFCGKNVGPVIVFLHGFSAAAAMFSNETSDSRNECKTGDTSGARSLPHLLSKYTSQNGAHKDGL